MTTCTVSSHVKTISSLKIESKTNIRHEDWSIDPLFHHLIGAIGPESTLERQTETWGIYTEVKVRKAAEQHASM